MKPSNDHAKPFCGKYSQNIPALRMGITKRSGHPMHDFTRIDQNSAGSQPRTTEAKIK